MEKSLFILSDLTLSFSFFFFLKSDFIVIIVIICTPRLYKLMFTKPDCSLKAVEECTVFSPGTDFWLPVFIPDAIFTGRGEANSLSGRKLSLYQKVPVE